MKAFFASLWGKLKGMFTKNLGIKISAVVFAILLWAYVLVVLNPVRTKLIDKVPISLEGYNDLLSRNLILVEQDLGQASVSIEAAITSHASLDASRINCRASLSTITGPGTYRLTVSATTQGNLGTVSKVSPSIVEVEVDKLIKKDIPVKVTYGESKLPEGYEILSENYSTSISVEGAARFVESAVRAEAVLDLTDKTKDIRESVKVIFYDAEGQEVNVVTRTGETPSISVYVSISAVKKVPVQPQLNLPDEEYYDLAWTCIPDTVTIYGDMSVLDGIDEILTEDMVLDEKLSVQTVEGQLVLPEGVSLKSGQSTQVKVTVTITEKEEDKELIIPVQYLNMPDGFHLAENVPSSVTVIAHGTKKQLSQLGVENIQATVDLTGRAPGIHEVIPVLKLTTPQIFPSVTLRLKESGIRVDIIHGN